jgi:hypothetical protein
MSNQKFVVELQQGEILPLERARGVRITAVEGTLWVTEEHDPVDVVLEAGESHAVETAGRTLVQAMGRSRLSLESPGAQPHLAFGELPAAA